MSYKVDVHDKKMFSSYEVNILKRMVQGMSHAEISKEINKSAETVKTHARKIREKCGVKNIQQVISKSVAEGWITIKKIS